MDKWKRKIINVLIVSCFGIWLLYRCDMAAGSVECQGSGKNAELIFYDCLGNVVYKEPCTDDRVRINYITDDIVEISYWFGSPFHYAFYYNVKTADLSVKDGPNGTYPAF